MTPAQEVAINKAQAQARCDVAVLLATSLRTFLARAQAGEPATSAETEMAIEATQIFDHLQTLSRIDEAKN